MEIRDLAENFHIIPVPKEMNNLRHPEFGGVFLAGFQQFALSGQQQLYLWYRLPERGNLIQQEEVVFPWDKFSGIQHDKIRIGETEGSAEPVLFLYRDRMKPP
jgi:hypothetical protein